MPILKLNIFYVETYDSNTFGIIDASTYPTPFIIDPTLTVCIPGFGDKSLVFITSDLNIFNSTTLGITEIGCEQELPDGIYKFKYCIRLSVDVLSEKVCVHKSFFRINKLQEKFHNAFLKLEIAECDGALKRQDMITLTTISTFIQTAVASANNCSEKQAMTLYKKANSMLDKFLLSDCGCH